MNKIATCELENELFKNVYDKTPEYIKNLDLLNFENENESQTGFVPEM